MSFDKNPYYEEFLVLFNDLTEQIDTLIQENEKLRKEIRMQEPHLKMEAPPSSDMNPGNMSDNDRIALRQQLSEYIKRINDHLGEEL